MIEKVNPQHPDKVADRVAGALVDLCYTKSDNPKCAFEVLIGHGKALIIAETSEHLDYKEVKEVTDRIAGEVMVSYKEVPQDKELSKNQSEKVRAGDNGIFKGVPVNDEVAALSRIVRGLYRKFPTDGKFILNDDRIIACQSNATNKELTSFIKKHVDLGNRKIIVNPLGEWTGGTDVDTGAVNRKLGSDMGEAVTGGGLHGKDLSKADVSVNIYAHMKAQETGEIVNICCAIGDELVDGMPYEEIVDIARYYIEKIGGFEALGSWGLV
jgi:S-adenosylmethionine synthetase